jgi:hypothetical protein
MAHGQHNYKFFSLTDLVEALNLQNTVCRWQAEWIWDRVAKQPMRRLVSVIVS